MKKKQFETILYSTVGVAAMFVLLVGFNVVSAAFKQRIDAGIGVDRRCTVLHQSAGIGGRSVVAVQIATEHPQHRHLLPSMMRRVRQAAREYPRAR